MTLIIVPVLEISDFTHSEWPAFEEVEIIDAPRMLFYGIVILSEVAILLCGSRQNMKQVTHLAEPVSKKFRGS